MKLHVAVGSSLRAESKPLIELWLIIRQHTLCDWGAGTKDPSRTALNQAAPRRLMDASKINAT